MTNIEENVSDTIYAYLNKQLSEEEEQAFEIRMLDDDQLLSDVELSKALQNGLKAQPELLKPSAGRRSHPFFNWLKQPLSMTAAALLVLLAVSNTITLNRPGVNSFDTPIMIQGSRTVLEPTRNSGLHSYAINGTPPYILQISLGAVTASHSFDLSLSEPASNNVIFQQSNISPDHGGWLWLVIEENLSGEYLLSIQSQASAETYDYRLNIGQ